MEASSFGTDTLKNQKAEEEGKYTQWNPIFEHILCIQ